MSLVTSTWPPPPGFSALLVPEVDVNVKKYTPFISYLSTIVPQLYGSQDAKTNKIINVKKGQFLAPWDMSNVIKKISDTGNSNILITERGASFGYNTLVSDMRSIPIMAQTGYPIVFDATHSVQQPGGMGDKSGGERKFVSHLSRAAVAVGIAAVFIETHQDPDNAPSDGPNMVPLNEMDSLVNKLLEIDKLIKN